MNTKVRIDDNDYEDLLREFDRDRDADNGIRIRRRPAVHTGRMNGSLGLLRRHFKFVSPSPNIVRR